MILLKNIFSLRLTPVIFHLPYGQLCPLLVQHPASAPWDSRAARRGSRSPGLRLCTLPADVDALRPIPSQSWGTCRRRNSKGEVLSLLLCVSTSWCHCQIKLDAGTYGRTKWKQSSLLWLPHHSCDLDISWGPAAKKLFPTASQAPLSCIVPPA